MAENIQFLIPSSSCLKEVAWVEDTSDIENTKSNLFVDTVYPTRILSKDQAQQHFKNFTESNQLNSDPDADITRCCIVMGGQGSSPLIQMYLDALHAQLSASKDFSKPMEIVVGCGKNAALESFVKKNYAELFAQFPNVTLKVLGFVPNEQFIAYQKNAVLITKAGGATISECIQNRIQALVHFDPNLYWEKPNVQEIVDNQLGETAEPDKLLSQIQSSMEQAVQRKQQQAQEHMKYHHAITDLILLITPLVPSVPSDNSPPAKRQVMGDVNRPPSLTYLSKHERDSGLTKAVELLKALTHTYYPDELSLKYLHELKLVADEIPRDAIKLIQQLDTFLQTYKGIPQLDTAIKAQVPMKRPRLSVVE